MLWWFFYEWKNKSRENNLQKLTCTYWLLNCSVNGSSTDLNENDKWGTWCNILIRNSDAIIPKLKPYVWSGAKPRVNLTQSSWPSENELYITYYRLSKGNIFFKSERQIEYNKTAKDMSGIQSHSTLRSGVTHLPRGSNPLRQHQQFRLPGECSENRRLFKRGTFACNCIWFHRWCWCFGIEFPN